MERTEPANMLHDELAVAPRLDADFADISLAENLPPADAELEVADQVVSSQTPEDVELNSIGLPHLPLDDVSTELVRQVFRPRAVGPSVTLVAAATGSGKSSRIPLYLVLENEAVGTKPFIVVTQPRRIAAKSLHRRVNSELVKLRTRFPAPSSDAADGSPSECGFAVGQERHYSDSSKIVFVTTGWLLQKLVHNPEFLDQITDLVLDEVHERCPSLCSLTSSHSYAQLLNVISFFS